MKKTLIAGLLAVMGVGANAADWVAYATNGYGGDYRKFFLDVDSVAINKNGSVDVMTKSENKNGVVVFTSPFNLVCSDNTVITTTGRIVINPTSSLDSLKNAVCGKGDPRNKKSAAYRLYGEGRVARYIDASVTEVPVFFFANKMGLLNFVCPKQNLTKDECVIKGSTASTETPGEVTFVSEVTHTGLFEQWVSRTEYTVSSFLSPSAPLKYNSHYKIDAIMTTNVGFDELRMKYRNIRSTYYVKCSLQSAEYDVMMHDIPGSTPLFVKEEFGKMKAASDPSDASMTSGYIYLLNERLYDGPAVEVFPFTQFIGNTFCQKLVEAIKKELKNGKSNES
jgi:hypothetical protein